MAEDKKGFFSRLVAGLEKTRKAVVYGLDDLFNGPGEVDDEFFDELEEILITGDVGVRATEEILEELREAVEAQHVRARSACRDLLIDSIKSRMDLGENAYDFEKQPSVLLLIGVNGVGKTTTIGKLSAYYHNQGKSVLLAAADTFRAAAIEQLEVWGKRADVQVIKHGEGSDPAAVVFDALQAAKARRTELVIVDTAGRLQTKSNLMQELEKIYRVIGREVPGAPHETLLVLDAGTGQNAISQAELFSQAAPVTGVVLTKLDGTAKGGVTIGITAQLDIPIKWIGVGEGIDDLRPFHAEDFVNALFAKREDAEA